MTDLWRRILSDPLLWLVCTTDVTWHVQDGRIVIDSLDPDPVRGRLEHWLQG